MTGWGGDPPPDPIAEREAENVVRQFDHLFGLIRVALESETRTRVTAEMILDLNRIAVDGIVEHPGEYRGRDVEIAGSRHIPPGYAEVSSLVDDMVAEINGGRLEGYTLAAFALWRLNWIHPFEDGNGRTARLPTS